ncbi:hypothetical protein AB1Y20_016986 [Prymnesium parvum]|uniref:Uncharacterized protein n=1 Tax=Prymnesium parvum TaxID=97485 RepID=A0AB34IB49_PRYPA
MAWGEVEGVYTWRGERWRGCTHGVERWREVEGVYTWRGEVEGVYTWRGEAGGVRSACRSHVTTCACAREGRPSATLIRWPAGSSVKVAVKGAPPSTMKTTSPLHSEPQ